MECRLRKARETEFPVYTAEIHVRHWHKDAIKDLIWDLSALCDVEFTRAGGQRIVLVFPKDKASDEVMKHAREIYKRIVPRSECPSVTLEDVIAILEQRRDGYRKIAGQEAEADPLDAAAVIAQEYDSVIAGIKGEPAARAAA